MTRTGTAAVIAVTLTIVACDDNRAAKTDTAKAASQTTVDTLPTAIMTEREARLGQYFERDVTPRLKKCWDQIKGEGRIAFTLRYQRTDAGWTWQKLAMSSSSLSKEQDAIAARCVEESVRATSFPISPDDQPRDSLGKVVAVNGFNLNWSFPVPLPGTASTALAIGTGGGPGAASSCWQCGFIGNEPSCLKRRGGWPGCIELDQGGCICFGDPCASGGYRGISGGAILML